MRTRQRLQGLKYRPPLSLAVVTFVASHPLTTLTIASPPSGHELDVLIFPDVGMEPFTLYLSFARLARVQMAWWGHPVTTASPTMDYFISLEDELDEAQEHYTEQLVRMKVVNAPPLRLVGGSDREEAFDGSVAEC